MFYKENEFQRKMEEKKMAKLAEDLERLRLRVAETDSKLREKEEEKADEKDRLDDARSKLTRRRLGVPDNLEKT